MTPPRLEKVESKAQREAFIRVPWRIYRNDPAWVPPLLMERRDHLNPAKNPLFHQAETAFWIARSEGEAVGRISAQVNHSHLTRYQDGTGQFGLLDAVDDPAIYQALLGAAEGWLRERGMTRVQGPFSLSINEESGLLVEGFDTPPSILMGHHAPHAGGQLESLGYAKAKDLLAYHLDLEHPQAKIAARLVQKARNSDEIVIRPLSFRRFESELRTIMDIYNDAWSQNWNFLPFDDAAIAHMAKALRPLIEADHIAIAEYRGQACAMAVTLPNINEAISDLDGRLLPVGWAKLLWRLKRRKLTTARMPLMGVRRAHHGTILGAALAFAVIQEVRDSARRRGVESAELSWILEDNSGVKDVIQAVGGRHYKTYRIYQKALT